MTSGSIPVFIIEEHHEAFLIWNYAIRESLIPSSGNALLHIDEHSDMGCGRFRDSIHQLNGNLEEVRDFTYKELAIDTFISTAIYRGLFDGINWIKQKHEGGSRRSEMYVRSYNNDGKKLVIGLKSSLAVHQELPNIHIKYFNFLRGHLSDIEAMDNTILDIDLDFFSCTGHPYKQKELLIEISEKEFNSFANSPYHRLNFLFSRVEIAKEQGKYFYVINSYDEIYPEKTQVSDDTVVSRIAAFTEVLGQKKIHPLMINICRSRHSGFTPEGQWAFIEKELISRLRSLYDIRLVGTNDILSLIK